MGALLAGIGLGGVWPTTARAGDSDGIRADVSTGATVLMTVKTPSGTSDTSSGVMLGLTIDGRKGWFLFGANIDASLTLLTRDETFVGANVGVVGTPGGGPELIVLSEIGGHYIAGAGSQWLNDLNTPTAGLLYAGLRLGLGESSHRGRGDWGVWLYGRMDLAHERVTATGGNCLMGCGGLGTYEAGGVVTGLSMRYLFGSGRARPIEDERDDDDP